MTSPRRRKVLILTSSTGGGHDMRARSLQAWANAPLAADLRLDVEIFQTLETVSPLYKFGVDTYNWIQLNAPWLHHVYFNFLEVAAMHRSARAIAKTAAERFRAHLNDVRPDIIVSTHAHLNHGFFELARQALGADNVRCVTYCGEMFDGYGFCRHWANPAVDAFIGATPECCRAARGHGVPADRTHLGGFMLDPAFWDAGDALDQARADALPETFDPRGFTLVLSTGANSANNHHLLIDALERAGLRLQVVALCGRSVETFTALTERAKRPGPLALIPQPRLESRQMAGLLRCASVVLTRPGTGSTSEAIQVGCPLVHNGLGGVMPQEHLTLKYLRARGAERLMRRPANLPKLVAPLQDPKALAAAREQTTALHPGGHPLDVLRLIAG